MANQEEVRLSPEQIQSIAHAVAEPRRFAILRQIASAEVTPCSALTAHGSISAATVSHHLKELQEAGLVGAKRAGRVMHLTLHREVWQAYLRELSSF